MYHENMFIYIHIYPLDFAKKIINTNSLFVSKGKVSKYTAKPGNIRHKNKNTIKLGQQ